MRDGIQVSTLSADHETLPTGIRVVFIHIILLINERTHAQILKMILFTNSKHLP